MYKSKYKDKHKDRRAATFESEDAKYAKTSRVATESLREMWPIEGPKNYYVTDGGVFTGISACTSAALSYTSARCDECE